MNKFSIINGTLGLLLLCGCGSKPSESPAPARLNNQVVGLAEIQPEKKIISLYARTNGTVSQVFADMGDWVKKDGIIANLDSRLEDAQLEQARSRIATQEATINTNSAQLAALKVRSENAEETHQRNEGLIQSGAVTRQDLDNSRFAAAAARKDADAAEATVLLAQNRLKELRADVAYAEAVVDQKKIRAPYDGTILSLDIKVGHSINASQALGDFAPAGHLIAVTEIDEAYAASIKPGMKAYIKPQGKTDTLATGEVYLLSPYLTRKSLFSDGAANMEDRRVREVRVLLHDGGGLLIGDRVDCVIQLN